MGLPIDEVKEKMKILRTGLRPISPDE